MIATGSADIDRRSFALIIALGVLAGVACLGSSASTLDADESSCILGRPQTVSIAATVHVTPLPGLLVGDANMDGHVTVADAVAILQHTVRLRHLDTDQLRCADTNDDGRVTVADAVHIMQFTIDPTGERDVLARPLWQSPFDEGMLDPLLL